MPAEAGEADAQGITRLLNAWRHGDASARDRLFVLVYDELGHRAAGQLRRERRDHRLRPTAGGGAAMCVALEEDVAVARCLGIDRARTGAAMPQWASLVTAVVGNALHWTKAQMAYAT